MTQPVQIDIRIQDKPVKQIRSFKLDQAIFEHHQFEMICPVSGLLGTFNHFDTFIGSPIEIKLTSKEDGSLSFAGVITQMQFSPLNGSSGNLLISGFSPTIILDGVYNCRSWERKVLKNIVRDVLKSFPSDVLQIKITSAYLETLSYVVQYNETTWLFLKRLAADYGEWLYYNGQQLVFGLPHEEKINLLHGTSLNQFEILMQSRPTAYHLLAYDSINHEVYDVKSKPENVKAAQLDHQLLVERSQLLYSALVKQWYNGHVTNARQLNNFIDLKSAGQISDMVKYYGRSTHPGIQPGTITHIVNNGIHDSDCIILSVQHICDEKGNYNNQFMAAPASIKAPPAQTIAEPRCETQNARIIDNEDTKGLGRVRVRFHWMNEDEKSPWLSIVQPQFFSGKEPPSIMQPYIGQEVMVAFQGSHPHRPYILGTLNYENNNNLTGKGKTEKKEEEYNESTKMK